MRIRARIRDRAPAVRLFAMMTVYHLFLAALPIIASVVVLGPPGGIVGTIAAALLEAGVASPAQRVSDRRVAALEAKAARRESSWEQANRVRRDAEKLETMRHYGPVAGRR